MIRDLVALAVANAALIAAGHGVLRLAGIRPAVRDLPWSVAVAYVAGAAAIGVLGSAALVAGLALDRWQFLAICGALLGAGLVRRGRLRSPVWVRTQGWLRLFPVAILAVLALVAFDAAVQPIWNDDAWAIWAAKAESVVLLDGLDPDYLAGVSVLNPSYPLVVPVLELLALRFCGIDNELVPLQLTLLFVALPFALVALLRDRARPLLLWTAALCLALAPALQIQAVSALADVPLAVFFALAGVAGRRWVEEGGTSPLVLAAVFAAAAVGTKVEGGVFVALLGAALAVAAFRNGRPLRPLVLAAGAVVLSALPWELWSQAHAIGNAFSDAGGASPAALGRIPSATGSMVRELADPSSWLALVALAGCGVALALVRRGTREAAFFTLAVVLGSLAAMVAVYWLTPLDFDYHIATSVRRVITAPVVLAAAMAPLLLTWPQAQRAR